MLQPSVVVVVVVVVVACNLWGDELVAVSLFVSNSTDGDGEPFTVVGRLR